MTRRWCASAPGSMMIMGEHAVLWGAPCLVAAIDQRLWVELIPRDDDQIVIHSSYGSEAFAIQELMSLIPSLGSHRFVKATIQTYKDYLPSGFTVSMQTNLADRKGLGSSAAVVAAVQHVLAEFTDQNLSLWEKVRQGSRIVRSVQGQGSGADVAASIVGGIVYYQPDKPPYKIEKKLPLVVVFCGYKTPTVDVIAHVEKRRLKDPVYFEELKQYAIQYVNLAKEVLHNQDFNALGHVFEQYQNVMQHFGVEDHGCSAALHFLRQHDFITGAKISGSGLGDCVIGCGTMNLDKGLPKHLVETNMEILPIAVTMEGARRES